MQTDPLVKIVPTGTELSAYSPFFTTQSELNNAIQSGKPLGDTFGLPLSSQADSYDVYQMTPKVPDGFTAADSPGQLVLKSEVAPTDELNGAFQTTGGAQQYVVPNRGNWNTPTLTQSTNLPNIGAKPIDLTGR